LAGILERAFAFGLDGSTFVLLGDRGQRAGERKKGNNVPTQMLKAKMNEENKNL